MPNIRLPDGSQKAFPGPVTVAEIAQSIGPGLARAALAGRVNGKLVDTSHRIEGDADVAIVTGKDKDGLEILRHSTAHLLAYAVKELFPDAQVTIGPVIENGFYYDFSYKRPFTPEDLAAIEKKMAELAKRDLPVTREVWERDQRGRVLQVDRRALQGGDHRVDPRGRTDHAVPRGRLRRPVPRPARAVDRQAQGLQADEGRRRLLARRLEERDAPAHLRHGVGEARRSRTPISTCSRRRRSATTAASAPSSISSTSRKRRRAMVFWHPKGWTIWQQVEQYMRRVYRDNGYQEVRAPQILERSLWERSGHWENFKENMFVTGSENRDYAVKPMNCPGHILIYKSRLAQLSRVAAAARGVRELPPERAFGRAPRHHARARVHPGRRPHLLHRGPDPRRVRRVHRAAAAGLPRLRLHRRHLQGRDPPGEARRRRRALGQGRRRAHRVARALRLRVRRFAGRRARSTGRRSSTRSRTRSAASGSAGRCRSTSTCRAGSGPSTSPRTTRARSRSCCTGRSSARWSASSAS